MSARTDTPNEVYELSDIGFQDAIEIRQLIRVLRAQNEGGVNQALTAKGAGHAALVVRNSLLARLVVMVDRAYATSREGDRHVGRAFKLLDSPKIRAEFEARSSKEAVKTATSLWEKLKGDHRRPQIKNFRDKLTVHLGDPKDIPPPEYRDLFDFAEQTTNVMSALAIATNARTEPIEAWDEETTKSANDFWKPWNA